MLTLRHLYRFGLRQLTGFVESLFNLIGKALPVPEFSRISKRTNEALYRFSLSSLEKIGHIVIDSTGLKVFGEKEWLETKHGKQYQRKVWRKLHIGVEGEGLIVAMEMTDHRTDDRVCLPSLIDQVGIEYISELLADAGYDSHDIYSLLEDQSLTPMIRPPAHILP